MENVFENIAKEEQQSQPVEPQKTEQKESKPFDYNCLSNTPVGEMKKYERQDLHVQTVKIYSAEVFEATSEDEEIVSLKNKDVKYKKAKFILTYDTKNKDDMRDREYLSGIIQFVQKDGKLSDMKFYNADAENQVASLWKLVAAKKNIKPEELSPREFMGFLNSGTTVLVEKTEVKYNKEKFYKNLPKAIL